MRSARSLMIIAAFMFISAAVPATAQINPFRSNRQGPKLSGDDQTLLFESISKLNTTHPLHAGESNAWSNPKTDSSGTNAVEQILTENGMPCHRLRHHIVAQGREPGRTFVLTWCRTPQGEWKIKE